MEQVPYVAVWMVTYNHENFIGQAIESVLNQQTSFSVKLYIGEDCSTDKTGDLCEVYAKRFPEKVQLIRNPTNLGANSNGIQTYKRCFESGAKYIALCEGDDYWIDNLKLQKQVDFLDNNKGFALTFHNCNDYIGARFVRKYAQGQRTIYDFDDFVSFLYSRTHSLVFRNPVVFPFELFRNENIGDWALCLYILQNGKAFYFDEVMGAYRIHQNGIWNKSEISHNTIRVFETFQSLLITLRPEFRNSIEKQLFLFCPSCIKAYFLTASYGKSAKLFLWFFKSFFTLKVKSTLKKPLQ